MKSLKNNLNVEQEEKESQIRSEIRERWKQKLKDGIKKEDIECSRCGKVCRHLHALGLIHT